MSVPLKRAADLLRTLGDDTRLQILALLRRREFCVCELVALFPISQPAVSGHLRRLKDAGLAVDERRGMWVYYRARPQLPALVQAVLDEVETPEALDDALRRVDSETCCDAAPLSAPVTGPHGAGGAVPRGSPPVTARGRRGDAARRRMSPK